MFALFLLRRHRRMMQLVLAGMLLMLGTQTVNAEGENLLLFRPHCEKQNQKECAFYKIENPTSLGTPELKVGDVLDFDIVLVNPTKQPIRRVRTWLSYDASILEGSGVTLNLGLPLQLPGEKEFAPAQGYVKIGSSAEEGALPKDEIFPIARVQFRVKAVPGGNKLPIAFYDLKADARGHTYVASVTGDTAPNILAAPTATLIVNVGGTTSASSASSVSTSSASSVSTSGASSATFSSFSLGTLASSASSVTGNIPSAQTFSILQVQNVRIGTDNDVLYVTWDEIASPVVKAYNVYYGTTQGRYIQRRTVGTNTDGIVIHNLPVNTTYYAAVRAVDEAGNETAFSKEVAVQIGNPGTSTAPVLVRPEDRNPNTGSVTPIPNPVQSTQNKPVVVPGAAGLPPAYVLALIVSAAVGTLLAIRRQFVVLPTR